MRDGQAHTHHMEQHYQAPASTSDLFANSDPEVVWRKTVDIISLVDPAFNFPFMQNIFEDVMRLFRGKYPGYCPIKTPYHDQSHTLDVFLCAMRLVHGLHVSGTTLNDHEIALVMVAVLMHDVGYAQLHDGNESGTGAQYTKDHIMRGIRFMRQYFSERKIPARVADELMPIILCSDPMLPLAKISFPNTRIRLLGQILGTADLVGQMADRNYLEKLPGLYQELAEGKIGNYISSYDLICKTHGFYATIKNKLDRDFASLYTRLTAHFQKTLNTDRNYYMESITKNMDYLEKVIALGEAEYLSMLRRGYVTQNP